MNCNHDCKHCQEICEKERSRKVSSTPQEFNIDAKVKAYCASPYVMSEQEFRAALQEAFEAGEALSAGHATLLWVKDIEQRAIAVEHERLRKEIEALTIEETGRLNTNPLHMSLLAGKILALLNTNQSSTS